MPKEIKIDLNALEQYLKENELLDEPRVREHLEVLQNEFTSPVDHNKVVAFLNEYEDDVRNEVPFIRRMFTYLDETM